MSEEKKSHPDSGNRAQSPEKLNEYIRIGSAGGFILITALIVVAAALLIWGFTGRVAITMTEPCIVTESMEESHTCMCYVGIEDKAREISVGNPVNVMMPDAKTFTGTVFYKSEMPYSADELRALNRNSDEVLSDWVIEQLLDDSTYSYLVFLDIPEDISDYWYEIAEATIVLREVRPIAFLMK